MRFARGAVFRIRAIELRLLLRAVEIDETRALLHLVAEADANLTDLAAHLAGKRGLFAGHDQRRHLKAARLLDHGWLFRWRFRGDGSLGACVGRWVG